MYQLPWKGFHFLGEAEDMRTHVLGSFSLSDLFKALGLLLFFPSYFAEVLTTM